MKDITYTIKFYGYWHAGGKDGASAEVDNAVLKDKNGLPYIGGKTMKGLIKDGARFVNKHNLYLVSKEFIDDVFGEKDQNYDGSKSANMPNKFSSAVLKDNIEKKYAPMLYHIKQQTALVQDKQAKKHSLRSTEVTIPVVLEGKIENFDGDKTMLKYSLQAVKKLGEKRFRGLGRCIIEIIEES